MMVDLHRILVVDDSEITLLIVKEVLTEADYDVWTAVSGEEALGIIKQRGLPHLAIVDYYMPGMNGYQFCQKVHKFSDLPVLMLTAEGAEKHVVEGLNYHAEDYMVKPADGPIRGDELVSRVGRILRRLDTTAYKMAQVTEIDSNLQINFAEREAVVGGKRVNLTPTEAKLLHILIQHAGRTLTNEYLLRRIWPLEEAYEERLHTHIYRLRQKIEKKPREPIYVVSDWGKGYHFPAPNQ